MGDGYVHGNDPNDGKIRYNNVTTGNRDHQTGSFEMNPAKMTARYGYVSGIAGDASTGSWFESAVWGPTGGKVFSLSNQRDGHFIGKDYFYYVNGKTLEFYNRSGSQVGSWQHKQGITDIAEAEHTLNRGPKSYGSAVNGTVENQAGEPVPNATVRIMGVDKTQLSVDPSQYDQKADELLAEAENVTPPEWERDPDLESQFKENESVEYVAVDTKAEWSLRGRDVEDTTVGLNDDLVELGDYNTVVDPGDTIVLSVWKPSKEAIAEDGVDSDHLGRTVPEERTIVIEQIGPGGDVIDTTTRNTTPTVEITTAANLGTKTHHTVDLDVSTGFYRVYVQNKSEQSTMIAVGDPEQMLKTWETDLKDKANASAAKADRLEELIQEDKKLKNWTVQTDENGSWSKDIPADYITVAVTAYKGPYDKMTKGPDNATVQDIRAYYETTDYNGSVAVAPAPTKVSPPESGVTITVAEQTAPPRTDTNVTANLQDLLEEYLQNRSLTDVSGAVQQALEDYDRAELEDDYERYRAIIEGNDALRERYNELLDEQDLEPTDADPSTIPRSELETRVQMQEQTWYETSSTMGVEETSTDVGQETISAAMEVAESVTAEDVTVIAHYSNGTSQTVADEYVTVDQSLTGSGSTVQVTDFPVGESDPAAVTFEFRVANENGIAKARETIENPQSNASAPDLKTISFSTLEPGPDETVGIEVIPADDSTFQNVTNVTVYGPDNAEISTDAITDGTETSFTTSGAGTYRIVLTMSTTGSSETFTEVIRLSAADVNRNADPTVRLVDTHSGVVPLTGDGLEEAEVKTTARGDVTIAPVVSDDITGLDIFVQAVATKESNIAVRLLQPDGSSYRKSVGVRIHTTRLSDDAYVYRNEEPITSEGGPAGSREDQPDQTRIDTFTESDGSLQVTTIEDPGPLQQAEWLYRTTSPFQPFTVLPDWPVGPGLGASAGVLVVAGVATRRRR